jgi:hypothetical protein
MWQGRDIFIEYYRDLHPCFIIPAQQETSLSKQNPFQIPVVTVPSDNTEWEGPRIDSFDYSYSFIFIVFYFTAFNRNFLSS